MNEFVYNKFLKELCAYFEKKVATETANVWYNEINKIPEESLNYILLELKKKESFPRNLPAANWAIYYQWLKDTKKQAFNDCQDCDGSGWISFNRKAYKCATCNSDPLSVFIDIPGFSGNVIVKTKTREISEDRIPF